MNLFTKNNFKRSISSILLTVFFITFLMPILPGLFNGEDNRVVAEEVYSTSDLATKAAQNNIDSFLSGKELGAYDIYILSEEADIDVASWVYGDKTLKDKAIDLAVETLDKNNIKKASAKEIAYEYAAMINLKEDAKAQDLLKELVARQNQDGGFASGGYSAFTSMPVLDILGRLGEIDKIDEQKAIDYILSQKNDQGAMPSIMPDFMATAQGIRALEYLKEYASDEDKNKIDDVITDSKNWIQGCQQEDGSFKNGAWDDAVVDTAEAIVTLKVLNEDLNKWTKNGKGPVDYMKSRALNSDGTFGDGKNISDNTYALDAYIKMGAKVDITTRDGLSYLATKAAQNNIDLFLKGKELGAYDIYILSEEADVDVASYVYGDKSLKDKVINLADKTLHENNIKKASAKEIAYEYAAMINLKEDAKAQDLLKELVARQNQDGGFASGGYSAFTSMPVLDILGRLGEIDKIDEQKAIDYILSQKNDQGAMPSIMPDFMATAQGIRALEYLKEYVSDEDKNKIDDVITDSKNWIQGCQQEDGSFKNGAWDDAVVDTAEAILTLKVLNKDLNTWITNGKGPVDYMKSKALNSDGTFGDGKNISDNTYALDAYIKMGATVGKLRKVVIEDPDDGDTNIPEGETACISVDGRDGYILRKTEVEIRKNDTVMSLTKRILDKEDIDYEIYGEIIVNIEGQVNGGKSGWMFNVNGETSRVAAGSVDVDEDDYIEWYYTLDYTNDDRNNSMNKEEAEEVEDADDAISNDEYKDDYNKVIDKDSSEKEIAEAVEDAADKLNKKVNDIESEKDAKKAVDDVKDVSKIIGEALKRVESQEKIKDIAKKSNVLTKSLIKCAEKVTDVDAKKEIHDIAVENIDLTVKLIDKIQNENDVDTIANSMIESAGGLVQKLGKENTKGLNQKIVKLAQQVIDKAVTKKVENNKVTADIVDAIAEKLENKVKKMEQKLVQNNIEINKAFEKKLTLDVISKDKEKAQMTLESQVIDKVLEKGLHKVDIKTNIASFSITPNTFGDKAKGKDITLDAKKVNTSDITKDARQEIPNGSVVVDFEAKAGKENISKFKNPIEVSIPYEGNVKNKENITVFYINDNGSLEPMGGVYNEETKTVKFITNHFSKYFAKEYTKEFSDLDSTKWAKDSVEIMASKGIINGKENNKFSPNDNITRAEFAALISRMLKYQASDNELSFKDVNKQDWYYDSINIAYQNKTINGKSETVFDPNGNITRQEIAKIISNVLEEKGYKKGNTEDLNIFKDKENIASWAVDSVGLSVKEGLITGMDNGTFAPNEKATRAQAAVMLHRLYNLIMD